MYATICDDPKLLVKMEWYAMRVTYSRELKVQAALRQFDIESFVPMRQGVIYGKEGPHYGLVPAIHNLIFVRSTQSRLTELKRGREELSSLRYMTRPKAGNNADTEIIIVSDRAMENFMRVASVTDDRVMFLDSCSDERVGQRVRVMDGYFAGVEGIIRRIKKNKRVVVSIEGCASVAIAYVPRQSLMII